MRYSKRKSANADWLVKYQNYEDASKVMRLIERKPMLGFSKLDYQLCSEAQIDAESKKFTPFDFKQNFRIGLLFLPLEFRNSAGIQNLLDGYQYNSVDCEPDLRVVSVEFVGREELERAIRNLHCKQVFGKIIKLYASY